jgi:O-antigen ligase
MQQNISIKNEISGLQFSLLGLSFFLSVFITPVAVVLNKIFSSGYIYFSALTDVIIVLSLILNIKNLNIKNFRKIDWLVVFYLVLSLVYVLIDLAQGSNFTSVGQGFLTASRLVLVFLSIKNISFSETQISSAKKLLILILGLIVIGVLAQLIYPSFLNLIGYQSSPVRALSTVDGTSLFRVQSLLRGPNPLGAFLLIPLSFMLFNIGEILKNKAFIILTISSLLSLILTWSRSAWLGFLLIFLFWLKDRFKFSRKSLIWVLGGFFCLIISIFFYVKTDSFKTVFLHDKPGVGGSSTSDQNRISSYKNTLNLIIKNPLGLGISHAGPASVRSVKGVKIIENYYLQIGLQLGWLGLGILILIFLAVLSILFRAKDSYGRPLVASFMALSLVGMMQPVWVDVSATVWWWSLFGLWLHNRKKNMI